MISFPAHDVLDFIAPELDAQCYLLVGWHHLQGIAPDAETAAGEVTHRGFERLVEGAGADKVLYGSDMPLFDARIDIARVVTADIPDDAKRRILGLNAIELLGLDL